MSARTSEESPIAVDFVPVHGVSGRLGITLAPGKKQPHPMTGRPWARDVKQDVDTLRREWKTDVLVSLTTDNEFVHLGNGELFQEAPKSGMEHIHFPIPDGGAPSVDDSDEQAAFSGLVRTLLQRLSSGKVVVVHCKGGLGRSGLVAACVVVSADPLHDSDSAIKTVRAARKGAIETARQVSYIGGFAKGLALNI